MGLLDDAIREHLDLKRRHGADPAEIERAEQEALGPVRRGPEEPSDLPLDSATIENDTLEQRGEEELEWDEPPPDDAGRASPSVDEPESPPEPTSSPAGVGHDEDVEQIPTEEHEPATAQSHPAEDRGEETVEYHVELEEPSDNSREDVLEETPEFLQDTPDHDRLWFEQRPPRDFDFDG
jgi:hypothetical protein